MKEMYLSDFLRLVSIIKQLYSAEASRDFFEKNCEEFLGISPDQLSKLKAQQKKSIANRTIVR